jgi:hypothetical protein
MMQEIHSREYERKLQLLPGSEAREAALVNSVEELKAQMEFVRLLFQKALRKLLILILILMLK